MVIELKRSELPEVVLNNLYKQTQLQDTFGINMVALVDGQPKLLSLKAMLIAFLAHRREVVTRRTSFELRKARERAHVQEGLAVALSNVDEIIALIKGAPSPAEARVRLLAKAWPSQLVADMLARAADGATRLAGVTTGYGLGPDGYRLSETQAQRILEMQLQRLTALEQDKIVEEYRELLERIADLLDILARPARITAIIAEELKAVKEAYGDARKSEIVLNAEDIAVEDLIAPQDVVVTFSHAGYIKAQPVADYRAQRRGGRGKQAASMREDDFIERVFIAHTHDFILCFSSRGQVYWLKGYEVPAGTRASRGRPIVNLFPLAEGERISAVLPVKSFDENRFVVMATAKGTVKKTPLSDFSRPREKGIIAVDLEPGDYLIGVAITAGESDVMLFSDAGKAVRFEEADVRPMGRAARGVRGMKLADEARVISMLVADDESKSVLTATENGYGKRTPLAEYPRYGRGTQGVIAIQTTERNGKVVGAALVDEQDEIMLVSTGGVLIRTAVGQISKMGRVDPGRQPDQPRPRHEARGDREDRRDRGRERQRRRTAATATARTATGTTRRRRAGTARTTETDGGARLQLQRGTGGAAGRGAAPGRRGDARLARQRHGRDGDEPSRPRVHLDRRPGRGGPALARRHPVELQGALPPGRRLAPVRDGADEPARREEVGRLREHRRVVEEGDRRGEKALRGERGRVRGRRQLHLRPRARRRGSSIRTPRTCTSARTRPSAASSSTGCRTPATCRSSPTCPRTSCRARSTSRSTG